MKKKVIGLVGAGCLLLAGQVSATKIELIAGYRGPPSFHLPYSSKSLEQVENWEEMTVNDDVEAQAETNRWRPSGAERQMGDKIPGSTGNHALVTSTGFSIGRQGNGAVLHSLAKEWRPLGEHGVHNGVTEYNGRESHARFQDAVAGSGYLSATPVAAVQTIWNENARTSDQGSDYDFFPAGSGHALLLADVGGEPVDWSMSLDRQITAPAAPVPEPGAMLLFGVGLLGLAGIGKRLHLYPVGVQKEPETNGSSFTGVSVRFLKTPTTFIKLDPSFVDPAGQRRSPQSSSSGCSMTSQPGESQRLCCTQHCRAIRPVATTAPARR